MTTQMLDYRSTKMASNSKQNKQKSYNQEIPKTSFLKNITRKYINYTKYTKTYVNLYLKAQRQMWDILQGGSSLGVKFTRKVLAWYDK